MYTSIPGIPEIPAAPAESIKKIDYDVVVVVARWARKQERSNVVDWWLLLLCDIKNGREAHNSQQYYRYRVPSDADSKGSANYMGFVPDSGGVCTILKLITHAD